MGCWSSGFFHKSKPFKIEIQRASKSVKCRMRAEGTQMQDELAVGSVLKRSYNMRSRPIDVRLQSLNAAVQCSIDTSSMLFGPITLSGLPRNDISCKRLGIHMEESKLWPGPCWWRLSEGGTVGTPWSRWEGLRLHVPFCFLVITSPPTSNTIQLQSRIPLTGPPPSRVS